MSGDFLMNKVIVFGFDYNVPLEFFFEDYLVVAPLKNGEKTVQTRRSQLLGDREPMNWIQAFNLCDVYTTVMKPYDLATVKTLMKRECKKIDVEYAHFDSALNAAFKWGISIGLIPLTEWDLSIVKQNKKSPAKIEWAPEDVIDILRTKRLGETDFLHLRNYCIIVISLLHIGARTGKEILGQRENHIKAGNLHAMLIRENGDKETVPYRRSDIAFLEQLVEMNHEIRKQYGDAGGKPADGADALFINPTPRVRDGKLTFEMSNNDIQSIIEWCAERYGFNYIAPSVFRRNSCVYGQIAAMCCGFHESYVSNLRGHENETERDHYSRIVGPEIEFINRHPKENIELQERIFSHSIHEWLEKPHESRHLACAITTLQSLGRFEMREKLSRYRAGDLDLDRFPHRPFRAAGSNLNAQKIGERLFMALTKCVYR
jgi:hypothetical protein